MITEATKIKIKMLEKGVTGASISRTLGVTRAAVYHVVAGRNKSKRIRRAIAHALGMRVSELWPGRMAA